MDKAREFIAKECPCAEQKGKGAQKDCSATVVAILGLMLMGLVSWLFLATLDSGSFLVACTLHSQYGFQ